MDSSASESGTVGSSGPGSVGAACGGVQFDELEAPEGEGLLLIESLAIGISFGAEGSVERGALDGL